MIVYVKSCWNRVDFNFSPFDLSNVSPYLNAVDMYCIAGSLFIYTDPWITHCDIKQCLTNSVKSSHYMFMHKVKYCQRKWIDLWLVAAFSLIYPLFNLISSSLLMIATNWIHIFSNYIHYLLFIINNTLYLLHQSLFYIYWIIVSCFGVLECTKLSKYGLEV